MAPGHNRMAKSLFHAVGRSFISRNAGGSYMGEESRRSFIRKFGTASALAAGGMLNLNPRAIGANDKVVLALIGGRNQGRGDALPATKQGGEVKTHCDIEKANN